MTDVMLTLGKGAKVPSYQSEGSAGCDVSAALDGKELTIPAGGSCLIPTGLKMQIPEGYEIQVRPRSGLALKHSVTVLNTPGTIDSDYRGELGVILINHSHEDFIVRDGDRIAQLVLCKVERASFITTDRLDDTARGSGGFGSTGTGH